MKSHNFKAESQSNPPFGYYEFSGAKKILFKLAQKLPRNFYGLKLALVLRKLTLQNSVEIVDANQFGLKLRVYPLSNLGDRILLFMPKFFEYDEFKLMSEYLKHDSTFIDIGGNMGIYSLVAAKYIDRTGNILSFEPNPSMAERFEFNIEINGFNELIDLVRLGVADKEDSFHLSLPEKNLGGASIVVNNSEENIMVKCKPLLDALKEYNIEQIDLLKIDIEKAEPLALNPFFNNAPRKLFPKMIFIESDEGIDLAELGYKFITRTRAHNSIYKL